MLHCKKQGGKLLHLFTGSQSGNNSQDGLLLQQTAERTPAVLYIWGVEEYICCAHAIAAKKTVGRISAASRCFI